jgi:hypothetical protein
MNSSSERGTFHSQCRIEDVIAEGGNPDTDEDVQRALELERMINEHNAQREANDEWKKNNLEYDLRSTEWICNKAKASDTYAQNIYAALCNQDWQKNEVWPLLKGKTYSCSWRYAGGIVADMREQGDYIDWYCSGMGGLSGYDKDSETYEEWQARTKYVPEGLVTDEIRNDLQRLGWAIVPGGDWEKFT